MILSDHGISVGEKFGERAYGAFCYDYTIRTFASYISPELKNKEIPNQVRHIDFMPTILDQLGLEIDKKFESLDGKSLLPLIEGKEFTEKLAYIETGNPLDESRPPKKPNVKSVRTSKWKLIFNEHNNTKELYDLIQDPDEKNNLIGKGFDVEKFLWEKLMAIQNNQSDNLRNKL